MTHNRYPPRSLVTHGVVAGLNELLRPDDFTKVGQSVQYILGSSAVRLYEHERDRRGAPKQVFKFSIE
jgi:hypothetical protein